MHKVHITLSLNLSHTYVCVRIYENFGTMIPGQLEISADLNINELEMWELKFNYI